MISNTPDISWISKNKEWPKTATALSNRLNEVIPNLTEIGIDVKREADKHKKSDIVTITNNKYQSTQPEPKDASGEDVKNMVTPQNIYNMCYNIHRIFIEKPTISSVYDYFFENPIFLLGLRGDAGRFPRYRGFRHLYNMGEMLV